LHTALFSTWLENRTLLVGEGLEQAGGNKLDYHFDGFEHDLERFPHDDAGNYIRDIDKLITDETARYIKAKGPDLSWVYLEYTDDIGHKYGDSPEMTEAIQLMDEQVGRIWVAIKSRQQAYEEDWLILITTDHGRGELTGRTHGGQSERQRTTWIVSNSDSLNARFNDMPAVVDILPSIAVHLQLEIPENIRHQLDGKSFID
jgi:predicted AlkP superfamily pyrophosphatase or phosphodiesterase